MHGEVSLLLFAILKFHLNRRVKRLWKGEQKIFSKINVFI